MIKNDQAGAIRLLRADDLPPLKVVIDANKLFPSAMLDDMTASFLADEADEERISRHRTARINGT